MGISKSEIIFRIQLS